MTSLQTSGYTDMLVYIALILGLAPSPSAQGQQGDQLRMADWTAKQTLSAAKLVVLGKVREVKDTAPRAGVSGVRPIEVTVDVDVVLKGHHTAPSFCFVYFFPYGGYAGALPVWVQQGTTGIFALEPANGCFRAVSDRRAIIPAHGPVGGSRQHLDEFVARATLPVEAGCSRGPYDVASDVSSITLPLVGSRTTRKLLEPLIASSDPATSACACTVAALVWKLDEPCLTALAAKGSQPDEIRATILKLEERERTWFRDNPVDWLNSTIDGWGLDGALLRLRQLLSTGILTVTPATCRALQEGFRSGVLDRSLREGQRWSSENAERSAKTALSEWLGLNCPSGLKAIAGSAAADH